MYVSARTQRKVVRIDVTATTSGISTAGQRAEDEEQDDERAEPTEKHLDEHARAAGLTLRLDDRVHARDVCRHALRNARRDRLPRLLHG